MIHFGTGGWRAVIGDEFTRANVRLLTQGLANRILKEGTAEQGVVIGYDRRFLSDTAAWWAIEVLVGNGIRVTLIDRPSPTPTTMWTVRRLGAAYGMAVTASHNPALYNGIKLFLPGGRDADQGVTDELTASLQGLTDADVRSVEAHEARSSELGTIQRSINWYLDAIIDKLDTETIRHAHMHIVLDPMFGVSETSLQTILLTARCQVDVIHDRHDPLFGGRMPSPTEGTVTTLRNAVVDSGADLGIATDGDADRLGIIDDTGAYLTPNQVLVLLYDYLLTRKGWSGPAVRNMSTTHLLDRVAAAHGQVCYEVPVGFKWISAKMAETGAVIGGESSGGLTVRGHIPGKDGVYAGSLLVEAVAASGKRLSELYAFISHLSPKPAGGYGDDSEGRFMHITPDFIVTERDGELLISLVGERDLPPLRLSPTYLALLEQHKDQRDGSRQSREAMTFLRHKVEQARWFIDAIHQREETLRKTMTAIVEHQRAFFLTGEVSALRPMILKDIAEATGLDISTISRVSNSKSVQTDYGVYMLKFFFGEGILNDEGESVSTREVREALAELIAGEDKRQPLSDEQLTQLLAARGYPIARRTVAKYREQLRLPVARLRREL